MKVFTVRVFHESLGDRPVLMNMSFQSLGKLKIESEDSEHKLEWSVDSMLIERGGASNQLYIFSHPSHPGWVLYVRDYQIIKEIKERHPHKDVPRKVVFDSGLSLALGFIAVVVVLLSAFFVFKDPLIDLVVKTIPIEAEEKLGGFVINNLINFREVEKYSEQTKVLQEVLNPLFQLGEKEGYKFKVFIADDKSLNAFALPGGYLVFNRGMLVAADNIEEIFGVAAHEMSHVIKRHTLRQMLSTISTYALVQAVLGDVSGVIAVLADNGAFLLTRMYSRSAEEEADRLGLEYIKKLNINPNGLISFFKKLEEVNKKLIENLEKKGIPVDDKSLNFLSTHPATDDRIAYLKSEIDSIESKRQNDYQNIKFDLKNFQKQLGAIKKEDQ
ncbi:MAG: M48 family metallopeptidase [Bdellovibrionales bacterium]|nr:M48 family metallopeptidase [Bdellovibrionales bacterium]